MKSLFKQPGWGAVGLLAIISLGNWATLLPAQSVWTGPAGGQWGAATNWSPAGVPNSVDSVVVWTNGVQAYLTSGGPFTNGTINVFYGGGLAVGADTSSDQLTARVSTGSPTFYVTNGGAVYFYAVLSGTQGFTKMGAGTLTFRYNSLAQPYTGSIQILGGTLGIQTDSSLGNTNNNVVITNGAVLAEASGANGGVFWLAPSRTISLAGAQAQIAVNNSAYTLVVPGVINESMVGSGLLWSSAGELVLSNANTFTGPMMMTAGTNDLSNANALQYSTVTVDGGILLFDKSVTGDAFSFGGLAGTADFALQNNASTPAAITLTVGSNNASTTFSGDLTGPGALVKTGTGTLSLTGANTYAGTTTISAGKLVTTAGSIGAGSVIVDDGATNNIQVVAFGQTLVNNSLRLGTGTGATMEFNNLVLANPMAPMVQATNLILNGTIKVNVYGPSFAYYPGTIPLLAYATKSVTGAGWSLGTLPAGIVATLNDTGSQLQLVITAVSNPVVAETVTFANTNAGFAINPAFCGLSYEKAQLTANLFSSNNTALLNVFGQITPGVLRIGGASVDATCWGGISNLTAITPAQVDAFAGFVNALPANWHVIYGINMIVNSPTNGAAEAAYVANALGSRLLGFEIGNEPDLYHDNTNYFPSNYSYSSFLPAWRALAAGLTNSVPGWASANGGNGWTLTGPASSYNTSGYTMPFATNEAGVISMLTQHYYRNSAAATNATMAGLLTPDTNLPVLVSNLAGAATANRMPLGFRMDESGSFSDGGNLVSSEYGAALWTLDVMFTEAMNDCQGVNFHGGWDGTYSPIWTSGSTVVGVGPEFYGLKLFSLMGQGSAIPATITPSPSVNLTAYGVRQTNGAVSALLINKETNTGVQLTMIWGTNVAAAQAMVLIGAALDSTNGYTLGGAAISADGFWAGGFQPAMAATNGQLTYMVPPMSAVWLSPCLEPVLPAITNRAIMAGVTLSATNEASDPNVPTLTLGYALPTKPAGATINATNGLVSWRPAVTAGGTSNQFTVVVTNTASLAATQSFWVGVLVPQRPLISAPKDIAGHFNLTISGSVGPDYIIQGTTNLAAPSWQPLFTNPAPTPPFSWMDTNLTRRQSYYRIQLGP